jgi:hypothetical protein
MVKDDCLESTAPDENNDLISAGNSSLAARIASLSVRSKPDGNVGPSIGQSRVGTTLLNDASTRDGKSKQELVHQRMLCFLLLLEDMR